MDSIGELKWQIQFKTYSASQDSSGDEIRIWSTGSAIFAAVEFKNSGSGESVIADRYAPQTKAVFTTRYGSVLTIQQSDIIVYQGDEYEIESILPNPERTRMMFEAVRTGEDAP